MSRPRILFLDAYDSFSNNITALLTTLLDADVSVLPIDSPLLDPALVTDFESKWRLELSRYDAVVCGPGPGSPDNAADVGLMRHVWGVAEEDLLPVLGVCLGFQSLVAHFGGRVRRLKRGLHGMVRGIAHSGVDVFWGVGKFKATLYHSLCGDIGQDGVGEENWEREGVKWRPLEGCPELVPLAWVEEERESGEKEKILMGVRHCRKPFWGLQYHPESVCTEEEGDRVILNWFAEAKRWNEQRGRVTVDREELMAREATKPSLLSRLSVDSATKSWLDTLETDGVLHSVSIPLAWGMQAPDVVEMVDPERSERIILDSANAAAAEARGDVRGRYSIIATGLEEALRIEHHTGDDYATVKLMRASGLQVDLSQRVALAPYGNIWGLVASFHDARHLDSSEAPPCIPFVGGFMGYITYEQGLADLDISLENPRPHHRPDVCLAWVTKSIVIDHLLGLIHIQHLASRKYDQEPWLERTMAKLTTSQTPQLTKTIQTPLLSPKTRRRSSRSTAITTPLTKEYEAKVSLCQEYIAAGDSYELCLTDQTTIARPRSDSTTSHVSQSSPEQRRRSSLANPPSSWGLFKTLRTRQPAPFASYIRLGAATLVSASPERFLTFDASGHCSMRPMKGTVRKSEEVATLAQAEQILHVPKEEAENLMIVDLVRHDLHGICGAGNVNVPELLKVEEYQSVFQMITVVEGTLPQDKRYTGLDVLAGSLPPGSMTGAPKKRSCEILRGIEGGKERSLYSGVVGYMCATGRGDWSVTIRSLFRWDDEELAVESDDGDGERKEVWHIGAGGAVTILSTPDGERDEMFTKLAGPLRVFGDAC
ncbi:hypothetical protein OQA88_6176 [Cercophora sp. LCS_1]